MASPSFSDRLEFYTGSTTNVSNMATPGNVKGAICFPDADFMNSLVTLRLTPWGMARLEKFSGLRLVGWMQNYVRPVLDLAREVGVKKPFIASFGDTRHDFVVPTFTKWRCQQSVLVRTLF